MQNFKLILSYDGSRYFGWQRQAKTDHSGEIGTYFEPYFG